jgi:hypothetical protein
MGYTHLGRSGVSVSRLFLGTMNLGANTSEADAHVIMDAAHEHGINFFDTSNTYGQPRAEGVTESVIGRRMAAGAGTARCWPRSCTAARVSGPTTVSCLPSISAGPVRSRCAGWGPTTSTCTRCTT